MSAAAARRGPGFALDESRRTMAPSSFGNTPARSHLSGRDRWETHTAATPAVKLFGKTPTGSEPTGITFTPDNKFMFISFQHPSAANATAQLDAAGINVVFNTHTTVVIARTENLGPTATLPVYFTDFKVNEENNTAQVNWSVANVINHSHFEIERSTDGRYFEKIYTEIQTLANGASQSFSFNDRSLPAATVIYYRIKHLSVNGESHYSEIKSIKPAVKKSEITIYPNPAKEMLSIDYTSAETNSITLAVSDGLGRIIFTEQRTVLTGKNILTIELNKLSKGNYTLSVYNGHHNKQSFQFTKL
jgi:hypothetical protein